MKKTIKCQYCKKQFIYEAKWDKYQGKRLYCSRSCANKANSKQNSKSKIGNKNPMWNKRPWNFGKKTKTKTKIKWEENIKGTNWGKKGFQKGNKTKSQFKSGEKHPNYIDGRKKNPYPLKFSLSLKSKIKNRDNFKCQFPSEDCKGVIGVHHIDYNKKNCDEKNLITLCNKHNAKVNFKRDYWINYFNKLIINKYGNERKKTGDKE